MGTTHAASPVMRREKIPHKQTNPERDESANELAGKTHGDWRMAVRANELILVGHHTGPRELFSGSADKRESPQFHLHGKRTT